MHLREHTFLGTTTSLCPECLAIVPAKIVAKGQRVYFRKTCPTHGVREDFVCSDVAQYDRMELSVPGRYPEAFGTEADEGCPRDCGLCPEHEQHTCVGLVELTSSCNLSCPMCYAGSGPGGTHLALDEIKRAIDRIVALEGRAEVVQLSGGEPTIHPQFLEALEYACASGIDIVMINSNGLRFAHDPEFVRAVAAFRKHIEVYLQFDSFRDEGTLKLRGEKLVATKMKAVEALGSAGIRTILVSTLHPGVNEDELGDLLRFGLARKHVTGLSLQPATYCGRHVPPEDIERRLTFPDVIERLAKQAPEIVRPDDFLPLPCAHPNCHSLAYLYRAEGRTTSLARFIDAKKHLDILANGITFTRQRTRQLIEKYLAKLGAACCGPEGCGPVSFPEEGTPEAEFFARALTERLDPEDVFRITITSFLDAYNFDVRRLMKCCIHHVLPSGHVVPFCAYNTLYRDGHLPLPPLKDSVPPKAQKPRGLSLPLAGSAS
ncbi:MAG: radical SAM protein [Gemmataceae bacterium]|nr:radical SAM protein [Gemmataceae bacterium]